ncbi:hypothetical protein [Leeuwenhoekiella sp. MAR_2009_132]|uniref:hypothetical protein n=1 Tax=Leeuwenhoekiella sp. MAR_2009_132 TaxID=1392489 RepID=UPI000490828C|nr:hypothetical protein [Leeuwenhoekiella sp. MAR_2009_132]
MYFTDNRISIDKRMEEGKTLLFPVTDPDYRQKAEKHARRKGSYPYSAFKTIQNETVFAGIAVPQ